MSEHLYSPIADEQLDKLERAAPDVYDDALGACELVFEYTSGARTLSTGITTQDGLTFRLPVPGRAQKVFWRQTPEGPRVEAVFPYPPFP